MRIRKPIAATIALMFCLVVLAGCGTTREVRIYQTLNASADTRILILEAAGQAYKRGELSEIQKEDIIKFGNMAGKMGSLASRKAKEWSLLNTVHQLNPDAVSKDQLDAAVDAYKRAREQQWEAWKNLLKVVSPYIQDWLRAKK